MPSPSIAGNRITVLHTLLRTFTLWYIYIYIYYIYRISNRLIDGFHSLLNTVPF